MADDIVKVKIDTDTTDSVKSMVKYTAVIGGSVLAINKALSVSKELVDLYKVQEQAERKLAGVVKATGGAAGLTTQEMINYAKSLQSVTTFGDETIINAQAVLATFKNVKDDAFIRTTEAALDMSTVLGTDLNSAMIQLGKAVNDPVLGVTALNRAGIQFTETQKDTIKSLVESNQLYKAQDMVLKEVEGQLGGSARAAAKGVGIYDQMGNAIGDLKEELGESVANGFKPFASWVTASTNAMIDFIQKAKIASITEEMENLQRRVDKMKKGNISSQNLDSMLGFHAKDIDPTAEHISGLEEQLKALEERKNRLSGGKIDEIIPPSLVDNQTALNESMKEGLSIWEQKAALSKMDSEASVEFYENEKEIADNRKAMLQEQADFEQALFEARLGAAVTFFNGWASLAAVGAEQSTALAIAFKALSSAEAGINSYLAYTKALATIPYPWNIAAASGVLAKGLSAQAKIWSTDIPKFANGADFVTSGRQMIMVGDNGTGRERVKVEPLGNTGGDSNSGVVHNVISLDGKIISDYITKASRDGRIITSARSVK